MPTMPRTLPAIILVALVTLLWPAGAAAHAALERSDPAAGAVLPEPPTTVALWFTEPLEETFTGADLLDASGEGVSGVSVAIDPENDHALRMAMPPDLADGVYTVAWRTLSSADGHTAEGYFGFRVGEGQGAGVVAQVMSADNQRPREITRGLALIGLAALLAIAPITLAVLNPTARAVTALRSALPGRLRRYAAAAIALALAGSVAALAAQAVTIGPDASLPAAVAQTLGDTRYGALWSIRIVLLLATSALVAAALWGPERWRLGLLLAASAVSLALPIPFSLLSHAAAQAEGRDFAVAADVLHVLLASVWAGGLFMLALVLIPVLRTLPLDDQRVALWSALAHFSAIGLAAWGILLLSGLYSAWLQVGSLAALRETPYGQALLLKGALLLPVLALAAFHLVAGRRGVEQGGARRVARTIAIEAAIVVAVLMVVGRLIGLEPAREVVASQTPGALDVAVTFATNDGDRDGLLTISPGAAGVNAFTLDVAGSELPDGSEGVLRFSLPDRAIGEQELRLPAVGANLFSAEGDDLALAGDWRITILLRQIGAFSWVAEGVIPVGQSPPRAPLANPAPLFSAVGVAAMFVMAIGVTSLAVSAVSRASRARRGAAGGAGAIALLVGALLLGGARLPLVPAVTVPEIAAMPVATEPPAASPSAMTGHDHGGHAHQATPQADVAAAAGTPVARDGLVVSIAAEPALAGPVDVAVMVTGDDGDPLSGARVVVFSEMAGMGMGREETLAVEADAGRYLAEGVPMGIAGEWRLSVRVSPRGQSSQTIPFVVDVQ